jgi:hypothetical protein
MATEAPAETRATGGPGPRTIPALWQKAASARRTNPAYLVEHGDHWHEISWDEAATAVEELANGLLSLGLKKGDAFGIVGRTTPERRPGAGLPVELCQGHALRPRPL